jgi:hypothetical protein
MSPVSPERIPVAISEVALTLVLMDTYITRMTSCKSYTFCRNSNMVVDSWFIIVAETRGEII